MQRISVESTRLARLVIAEEMEPKRADDTESKAAIRVCEQLRQSLSQLVGTVGFHQLLTRALSLSRREHSWLGELSVDPDGVLECPPETEAHLTKEEASEGGRSLVGHLLGLLTIFIGAALTQRLLLDSWPKAALNPLEKEN